MKLDTSILISICFESNLKNLMMTLIFISPEQLYERAIEDKFNDMSLAFLDLLPLKNTF